MVVAGIADRRPEEKKIAIGTHRGNMATAVGLCIISTWWSSGLLKVPAPRGSLDQGFFVLPKVMTVVALEATWASV